MNWFKNLDRDQKTRVFVSALLGALTLWSFQAYFENSVITFTVNNGLPHILTILVCGFLIYFNILSRWGYLFLAIEYFFIMGGVRYGYNSHPFGYMLVDLFDLSRNPYDRITHFIDGFMFSLIFRDILVTRSSIREHFFTTICAVAFGLSMGAFWEITEYLMVIWPEYLLQQSGSPLNLGGAGDPWDTQSDMICVFFGALSGNLFLGKRIDQTVLKKLKNSKK